MRKSVEKKNKEYLEFIENFIDKNGFSPTYREIAGYFGCSVSVAYKQIMRMREAKIISTDFDKTRTIRVVKKDS